MSVKIEVKKIRIIIAFCLSLSFSCGDPGYQLHPSGWQSLSERSWTKQFGDFEIQTRGLHGLIGESSVDPDLRIYNNGKSIAVESAQLRTKTEQFAAGVYDRKSLPPGATGVPLPVEWKFEQRAAPDVLGDHCEILVKLKIGEESRELKIEYEK